LTEEKNKDLEALMAEVGVRTKKDLFNNALTLLEWALRERKAGRVIASVDGPGKNYKELLMPILEGASTGVSRGERAPEPALK
jgi:hypothetical protein